MESRRDTSIIRLDPPPEKRRLLAAAMRAFVRNEQLLPSKPVHRLHSQTHRALGLVLKAALRRMFGH